MNREALFHMSGGLFAYPTAKNVLNVRLLAAKGDLEEAAALYQNMYDHDSPCLSAPMERLCSDGRRDLYEARLSLPGRRFRYCFQLKAKGKRIHLTANGLKDTAKAEDCFFYPAINLDEVPRFPRWAKGAVIYQIFVDRFSRGGGPSPERGSGANKSWGEPPDREAVYGGGFDGIADKLDYLSALGAEAVYLSPVFCSESSHKYDVKDYFSIDSSFGGEEALLRLAEKIHAKGMHLVLDFVFNHMSFHNPIFADVAAKGEASRRKDWFFVHSFPVDSEKGNYDSFAGSVPTMPRIDTSNAEAADYLISSAVHWTRKLSLDGLRLDVADELSPRFLRRLREEVLKANPDALLIGEIWNHPTRWLAGDQLHTATNYRLRGWLFDLIQGRIGAKRFWQNAAADRMLCKTPVWDYLVNLLGSHDTSRAASLLGPRKASLALLAILAYQGLPLIYYGDEVFLEGGEDPDNRRTMPWERATEGNTAYLRRFAAFRRRFPRTFREGVLVPLETEGRLLGFRRGAGEDALDIYVNFGGKRQEVSPRRMLFSHLALTGETLEEEREADRIEGLSFAVCGREARTNRFSTGEGPFQTTRSLKEVTE